MRKKITIIITTLIVLLIITGTLFMLYKEGYIFKKEDKEEKFEYMPLTYEICDDNSCIYLLGSIHVGDMRVNKFDKKLIKLYNESDSLAVELDTKNITLDVSSFILTPPETLDNKLTETEKEKITTFIDNQKALSYEQLKYFKLGYIYNYFSLLPTLELGLSSSGVDEYFLSLAHKDNKDIIEIETYEEQLALLLDYSDEFYINQINGLIDNYDNGSKSLNLLYETYLTANKDLLETLINEDNDDPLNEEEVEYINNMLYNRNIKMSNKVEELLRDDKETFMIVGLAHVLGEKGIIDLLEDKNYKISIIGEKNE